jgi:Protein of unknown function (DUF2938)
MEIGDLLFRSLVIGLGATVIFDLWGLLLNRAAGIPLPNWALVGRWFAHLPRGRFHHANIAETPPVANERATGWFAHYAVGVSFALATLLIGGADWAKAPTWPLPLLVGLVTVGCGWFILQPGMGAGIAASKKPNAYQIRLLNIAAHTVFGVAMYFVALAIG